MCSPRSEALVASGVVAAGSVAAGVTIATTNAISSGTFLNTSSSGSGTDGGTGSDGSDGGAANTPVVKGLSPNQMNRAIKRGQGPSGITRIDTLKIPYEKLHATFEDGSALKVDKTWKHGGLVLTRDQSSWLVENGWKLP